MPRPKSHEETAKQDLSDLGAPRGMAMPAPRTVDEPAPVQLPPGPLPATTGALDEVQASVGLQASPSTAMEASSAVNKPDGDDDLTQSVPATAGLPTTPPPETQMHAVRLVFDPPFPTRTEARVSHVADLTAPFVGRLPGVIGANEESYDKTAAALLVECEKVGARVAPPTGDDEVVSITVGEAIMEGRNWAGFSAKRGSFRLVAKLTDDVGNSVELATEMSIYAYLHTRGLVGAVVPFHYGLFVSSQPAREDLLKRKKRHRLVSPQGEVTVFCVLLEDAGAAPVGDADRLPLADKKEICHLYAELHGTGVLHGSAKPKHWLHDGKRYRLIDFGTGALWPPTEAGAARAEWERAARRERRLVLDTLWPPDWLDVWNRERARVVKRLWPADGGDAGEGGAGAKI